MGDNRVFPETPRDDENFNIDIYNSMSKYSQVFTGTKNKAKMQFETVNIDQHKSKCVSTYTTKDRIQAWVYTLATRYLDQIGALDEYNVKWNDVLLKDNLVEVNVTIYRQSKINTEEKLLSVKIYLTSGTIMIQGNSFKDFCNNEFPYLKRMVDNIQDKRGLINDITLDLQECKEWHSENPNENLLPVSPKEQNDSKIDDQNTDLSLDMNEVAGQNETTVKELVMKDRCTGTDQSEENGNIISDAKLDKMDQLNEFQTKIVKNAINEAVNTINENTKLLLNNLQDKITGFITCCKEENLETKINALNRQNFNQSQEIKNLKSKLATLVKSQKQSEKITSDIPKAKDHEPSRVIETLPKNLKINTQSGSEEPVYLEDKQTQMDDITTRDELREARIRIDVLNSQIEMISRELYLFQ